MDKPFEYLPDGTKQNQAGFQKPTEGSPSRKRAIALFSGGLDSSLAVRIMQLQGFEVEALFVETIFERCHPGVQKNAADLGVPLTVIPPQEEYVEIIRSPRFGYGQGANPCIDCRIYMCRFAKKLMEERGACVVISGELLGQRPMSQQRSQLNLVEKHSGLKGRLLRPLSAKLLSPTIPELEGLVDREKLYQFTGRSRKPLIELAHQLGVRNIPQPSIGCLLTQPSFAPRVFDLLRIRPMAKMWEFDLLRVGRHIAVGEKAKLVVGRNAEENAVLEVAFREHRSPECVHLHPANFPGPDVLITGEITEEVVQKGLATLIRYTQRAKLPPQPAVQIIWPDHEEIRSVQVPEEPSQIAL
jgi:hypothetical protein